MPTPTASNITDTAADLACPSFTGLTAPITYQWFRVAGDVDFAPGPVVVTPHDGSDGVFTPSSLTFSPDGSNTPAAQDVIYTPASNGVKILTFGNDGGLDAPGPLSYLAQEPPFGPFVAPTVAQVIKWTSINTNILDVNDAALTSLLQDLIDRSVSETALEVTEVKLNSLVLTLNEQWVLQLSVAYHAAGDFILCPQVRVLTGTQEPLLVESGADLNDVSRALHSRASELSVLFATGGDVSQIGTRMALNAMRGLR